MSLGVYKFMSLGVYKCRSCRGATSLQVILICGTAGRDGDSASAVEHHDMSLHRLVLGVEQSIGTVPETGHTVSIDGAETILLRRRAADGAVLRHIHIERPCHRAVAIRSF